MSTLALPHTSLYKWHALNGNSHFDLEITHVWGKSKKGKNVVRQYTGKGHYAKALKALDE